MNKSEETPARDPVEMVADALLYEGYLLYPYRLSSVKNRKRWNFGVLYPQSYVIQQEGCDSSFSQTECLLSGDQHSWIRIKLRFLQSETDEVIARDFSTPTLILKDLMKDKSTLSFRFGRLTGNLTVALVQHPLAYQLTVRVENTVSFKGSDREEALKYSFISAHLILTAQAATFFSLIDPPESVAELTTQCRNIGSWPVLAGRKDQARCMLASPIILYDYPQIATQSPGDLFDSTEIDEILSLRILTLSEAEKAEIRKTDERARRLLERTEALSQEQLSNLHGAFLQQPKIAFKKGDRVRLRPKGRTDILDIALDGKIAIVESIQQDFEDQIYLSVVVEDDPGKDLGLEGKPGHRFFFRLQEVERLEEIKNDSAALQ